MIGVQGCITAKSETAEGGGCHCGTLFGIVMATRVFHCNLKSEKNSEMLTVKAVCNVESNNMTSAFQLTLGGLRELEQRKNEVRQKHGLPLLNEDMYVVCENMRPASPPASAADLIEHQVPRRGIRAGKRVRLLFFFF